MAEHTWDAEKMLDVYVFDYLIKRKFHATGRAFVAEKRVSPFPVAIDVPGGFLMEWWTMFWEEFIARRGVPSDDVASTNQDHHRLRFPQQKQQQTQPYLANPLQFPHQHDLQARQAKVLQGHVLDQERVKILANKHALAPEDPLRGMGSALDADLLLKASNRIGQLRNECSPTLHPVVNCFLDHSRAGPVSHFPATVQSSAEQPPSLHQRSYYDSIDYTRSESALRLPTIVPNQTNVGLNSPVSHSEDLAFPIPVTQPVLKGTTLNDNALQVESMQIVTNAREKTFQLVGGKGYAYSEIHHLAGGLDKVECCQFSSDGKLMASSLPGNKVALWCTESFQIKSELVGHAEAVTDIRFSSRMPWLGTSSVDGTVRVWNADNRGQSIRTFTGHFTAVSSVDFHPQENDLICSCDNTKEIRYWTLKNGRCAGIIKAGATCLRFQPNGGRFLATSGNNVVSLYDVETQFCQQRIQDHKSTVHSLCWDFTGDHLASVSDDLVSVWRIGSGNNKDCIHQLSCSENKFRSCVFHPVHPSVLVVGCYKSLELWNMAENKRVTLDAHQDLVSAPSASSSDGYVASASHDRSIKIW